MTTLSVHGIICLDDVTPPYPSFVYTSLLANTRESIELKDYLPKEKALCFGIFIRS